MPPLRLTPDGAKLLANKELLRLSAELSGMYADREQLVTDDPMARRQVMAAGTPQLADALMAAQEARA